MGKVLCVTIQQLIDNYLNNNLVAKIDVREKGEYIFGHIPGSISVPRGSLESALPRVVLSRHTTIVFLSQDGNRACYASETAAELGYEHVAYVEKGIRSWCQSGRALEFGINVTGKRFGEKVANKQQISFVNPAKLKELLDDSETKLFDVRTWNEYAFEGHVPGAENASLGEIAYKLSDMLETGEKFKNIVVTCAGRTRGIIAANHLQELGYKNVYALKNGTMAWVLDGNDLVTVSGAYKESIVCKENFSSLSFDKYLNNIAQGIKAIPTDVASVYDCQWESTCPYLIDVRQPHEFNEKHLKSASNFSVGQLTNSLEDLVAVPGAPIVCYSNHGKRALLAAKLLSDMAYKNVYWVNENTFSVNNEKYFTSNNSSKALLDNSSYDEITTSELKNYMLSYSAIMIDIGSYVAFVRRHLEGSIGIPRGKLEKVVPSILAARGHETTVVVVGDTLTQCLASAETISKLGAKTVYMYPCSREKYLEAGLPIVMGSGYQDLCMDQIREEADLVGFGPCCLRRKKTDMLRYLEWEECLAYEN